MMTTNRNLKVNKGGARRQKEHPLYNAFTIQMSAALEIARRIKEDLGRDTSGTLQKFLEEFDKKAA